MANREELAGVRIDDCSLQEALQNIDAYLDNEGVNVVETINMKTIVAAGVDEDICACLENMDLVVPSDKEILQEMGITSGERIQEVQEDQLFQETMDHVWRGHHSLYLLTETEEQKDRLADYLDSVYEEPFDVCGSYVLESGQDDPEDAVNEINAAAPHVILAAISTPAQERFIFEHRQMLNIRLWFGIGAESSIVSSGNVPGRMYKKFLARTKMKRQIQSYETADRENEE